MAYQALYRSYRPNTFEEVFGQENIIKTIRNAIKNGKTSHAYIFSGPRGIGKTTIARIFAKAVNCDQPIDGEPCNQCEKCISIIKEQTTDIIELDAASNNGVDEMRGLLERVNFLPSFLKYKVYIIDEVHMLSLSAFNALLKTLEEPPKHVVFLMATTEPHKIPLTIHSRCQRFDFKPLTRKQIVAMLKMVTEKENIKIKNEAIDGIAEAAEGGMRDALGMLDQVSAYTNDEITLLDVDAITGRIANHLLINLIASFNEKDIIKSMKIVDNLVESGKEVARIVISLIQLCRDLLLYQAVNLKDVGKLIFENEEFRQLAEVTSKSNLLRYIDILIDIQNKIKFTTSPKIYLEVGIMKISSEGSVNQQLVVDNDIVTNIDEKLDLINLKIKKITDDVKNLQSVNNTPVVNDELTKKVDFIETEKNLLKLEFEEKFEILDIIQEILQEMQQEINSIKEVKIVGEPKDLFDFNNEPNQFEKLKNEIINEIRETTNLAKEVPSLIETNIETSQLVNLQELNDNYQLIMDKIQQLTPGVGQTMLIEPEEFYELKDHYLVMFEKLDVINNIVETLSKQPQANQIDDLENLNNNIAQLEENNLKQQEEMANIKERNLELLQIIKDNQQKLLENNQTIADLLQNINNIKDYSLKLGAKIQQIEDMQKQEKPKEEKVVQKSEVEETPKVNEEKTVVIKSKPSDIETIKIETIDDETSRVYDVKRVETVLHESREAKAREEKTKIANSWRRLSERISAYLLPTAQYLMDGMFVANGFKEIIIVYPNAQLCNYLMEERVHNEAKQVLKSALGKDLDFIALPENVWQEKRKEYHGQYFMGIKYPTLTPINNPELKIVKTIKESISINKNNSERKAEELFGPNLVKREV